MMVFILMMLSVCHDLIVEFVIGAFFTTLVLCYIFNVVFWVLRVGYKSLETICVFNSVILEPSTDYTFSIVYIYFILLFDLETSTSVERCISIQLHLFLVGQSQVMLR